MEGRADEAEADARSVMAVNAEVAPFGQPYLTARRMLVAALMHSGRHHEADSRSAIEYCGSCRRTGRLTTTGSQRSVTCSLC